MALKRRFQGARIDAQAGRACEAGGRSCHGGCKSTGNAESGSFGVRRFPRDQCVGSTCGRTQAGSIKTRLAPWLCRNERTVFSAAHYRSILNGASSTWATSRSRGWPRFPRRLGETPRALHGMCRTTLRRGAQAQLPKFARNAHPFFPTHS